MKDPIIKVLEHAFLVAVIAIWSVILLVWILDTLHASSLCQ